MKNIVILGAGFAGLNVARELSRNLPKGYRIKLVDKRKFHLYTPDLYEVATAFNEKFSDQCLLRLKETVATPIEDLIDDEKVDFIFDRVKGFDLKKKVVKLTKGKNLDYTYLVVAMGATVNFYGIEGLEEYSYPLKTVGQALAINCGIDQYFHDLWKKREHKKPINITICGGGATGVETAAEMVFACRKLCEKYEYREKSVQVQLVEGGKELVKFGEKGTKKILKRLKKLGVKVYLEHFVKKAKKESLDIQCTGGKKGTIDSNITIWTGGVKVNSVVANSIGLKESRGAAPVNEFLQYAEDESVFVLGDNAFIKKADGSPAPWLAQTAVVQAKVVARNILRSIRGAAPLKKYKAPKRVPMVIPVGGSYGFMKIGKLVFGGHFFYLLRNFIDLKYYLSIMPFGKAVVKWRRDEKIFEANN